MQAQDRAHRIGQDKPVNVIRLQSTNTVEGLIRRRAEWKRKLESLVLARGKLRGILKEACDDLVQEQPANVTVLHVDKKLTEDQIYKLLEDR